VSETHHSASTRVRHPVNETSPGGLPPGECRALPPGGKVPKDYEFVGENGPTKFSELFGDKQTLAIYGKRLP